MEQLSADFDADRRGMRGACGMGEEYLYYDGKEDGYKGTDPS